MTFLVALQRMKVDVTAHGFRSTFRDWAAECTNFPREVCEMALAHTVGNNVEAAYRRGDVWRAARVDGGNCPVHDHHHGAFQDKPEERRQRTQTDVRHISHHRCNGRGKQRTTSDTKKIERPMVVPWRHHATCGRSQNVIADEKPIATPFGP